MIHPDQKVAFLPGPKRAISLPMTTRAETEYRYEKLTWPEINNAVDLGKVCILPCGRA